MLLKSAKKDLKIDKHISQKLKQNCLNVKNLQKSEKHGTKKNNLNKTRTVFKIQNIFKCIVLFSKLASNRE